MARELGIAPEKIISAVASFKGLKRRLEKRLDATSSNRGVTIFDDIAHSPEKARVVLNTLKSIYAGKIIAVFEPNTGGRRIETLTKYDQAFADADIVVIPRLTNLKVSENDNTPPIEGDELTRVISKTHANATYIDDDAKLVEYLVSNTNKGDVIVFLGSHGFRGMIEKVIEKIR
jgi:UDP-N-acetylmuramate-alanine ligase